MGRSEQSLSPTAFKPLDSSGARRGFRLSPAWIGLGVVAVLAILVLGYLFTARAVIFRLDPAEAVISVQGLSFNIGDNFLLLPGERSIEATAEGYHTLDEVITVTGERTQEIELALAPLPGKLDISTDLEDVEVLIDDEPRGLAPGVIEDVSRGSHIVEFRKHRYFPDRHEVEVEGLGRTQVLEVSLQPAWGQMEFTSAPDGADVHIDDEWVGVTPLTTEVLETGTKVAISARGYKTWERQVTVKAGTSESHPVVELDVADGKLDITSSPRGANVTIDGGFQGTTPLTAELSPLGDHRVELFLEGYQKAVRSVSIEPEGHDSLSVQLTPIIGRIRLNVDPPDAEVVVDGRSRGQGSQTLSLTAREHSLVVRKPGFDTRSMTITPRPSQEQALDIHLLTVDQAYWSTRPPEIRSPTGAKLKLFRPNAVFTLGAPRREPGRRANEVERQVRLERPFYIATHEVTNREFKQFRGEHTSSAAQGYTLDMDDQPVVNVTWQHAALYCNWLSRAEGLPPFYVVTDGMVTGMNVDAHGYRLPTEAEWAWAAKIGTDGQVLMFPWGDTTYPPRAVSANYADQSASGILPFTLAAYNDGHVVSAPIGQFRANAKGLYDMSGNVSEWMNDFYEIRAGRGEPELDPTGPAGGDRHVIRGASWTRASRSELRLSFREAGADPRMDTGFRIARYVDRPGAKP